VRVYIYIFKDYIHIYIWFKKKPFKYPINIYIYPLYSYDIPLNLPMFRNFLPNAETRGGERLGLEGGPGAGDDPHALGAFLPPPGRWAEQFLRPGRWLIMVNNGEIHGEYVVYLW
jgi:hypothetical protein